MPTDRPWEVSQRRMFMVLAWAGALACMTALWVQHPNYDPLDRVALPLLALLLLALQTALTARWLPILTAANVIYAATTVYFLLALEQQFRVFVPGARMLSESTYWFSLLYAAPFLLYPPRRAALWAAATYAVVLGLCLFNLSLTGWADERLLGSVLQFLLVGAVTIVVQGTFGVQRGQLLAMREAAYRDALTGLANRRAAEERLDALAESGGRYTVVLFDLDHFKQVNDAYGHGVGDRVLRGVARAAREVVPPGGMAARWGGEEFVLLLPSLEDGPLRHLLKTLRAHLRDERHGEVTGVTASFGVAVARPGESPDDVVARADAAMYGVKRHGRDEVRVAETRH
ncbi:GGDEF domain-containing protein [Deinococcus sp. YIM 134068]|uniref:GGDEF domain-containing protein n=1 Tax=Deinococcus lichenicola TaxID=3118910 RepID=UPI002F9475EA